jgi:hypothetical protein
MKVLGKRYYSGKAGGNNANVTAGGVVIGRFQKGKEQDLRRHHGWNLKAKK